MIVHNLDPVLIDLGLFQIRWYSVAYILGIIIGWIYATKIIKLTTINKYNFEQIKISHFNDLIIYLVIGIVLGGRLGYVFFTISNITVTIFLKFLNFGKVECLSTVGY